ncbi:MAG: hypothetical protein WBD22_04075 [Pyrinomonadaceae bacterium]
MKILRSLILAFTLLLSFVFIESSISTTNAPVSISAAAQQVTVKRRKPGIVRGTYRGGKYVIRRTWDGTKWVSKKVWVGTKWTGKKTWRSGRKVVSRTKKIVY